MEVQDYVVQPLVGMSPPKWHLGHTTCFFEEFILTKFDPNYQRLLTEFEWEVAQSKFPWGARCEWTESAYVPYLGYVKAPGDLGEYNVIPFRL